jgi:hypothetical protein
MSTPLSSSEEWARCYFPEDQLLYVDLEVLKAVTVKCDRLCGLVVRVSGYRSRGSGFDFRRFQIF